MKLKILTIYFCVISAVFLFGIKTASHAESLMAGAIITAERDRLRVRPAKTEMN